MSTRDALAAVASDRKDPAKQDVEGENRVGDGGGVAESLGSGSLSCYRRPCFGFRKCGSDLSVVWAGRNGDDDGTPENRMDD